MVSNSGLLISLILSLSVDAKRYGSHSDLIRPPQHGRYAQIHTYPHRKVHSIHRHHSYAKSDDDDKAKPDDDDKAKPDDDDEDEKSDKSDDKKSKSEDSSDDDEGDKKDKSETKEKQKEDKKEPKEKTEEKKPEGQSTPSNGDAKVGGSCSAANTFACSGSQFLQCTGQNWVLQNTCQGNCIDNPAYKMHCQPGKSNFQSLHRHRNRHRGHGHSKSNFEIPNENSSKTNTGNIPNGRFPDNKSVLPGQPTDNQSDGNPQNGHGQLPSIPGPSLPTEDNTSLPSKPIDNDSDNIPGQFPDVETGLPGTSFPSDNTPSPSKTTDSRKVPSTTNTTPQPTVEKEDCLVKLFGVCIGKK
ncbi:hypothetical protein BC833DRAFT_578043 [Globomyces pollinis-pini]|nr:hypothetical protein BC833DRAFT_578043 [Globomyces pollinis-pini]